MKGRSEKSRRREMEWSAHYQLVEWCAFIGEGLAICTQRIPGSAGEACIDERQRECFWPWAAVL